MCAAPLERRQPGGTDVRVFTFEVLPGGRHRPAPGRPRLLVCAGGRARLSPAVGSVSSATARPFGSGRCARCGGLRWVEPTSSACWDCGHTGSAPDADRGRGPDRLDYRVPGRGRGRDR